MPGKRVQFDDETWQQIDLLRCDQMKDFQELSDEAFRDLAQETRKAGQSSKKRCGGAPASRRRYMN